MLTFTPVPETTSAEAVGLYAKSRSVAIGTGPAWNDVRVSIVSLPPVAETYSMPAVTEPFICWVTSGEIEAQERENDGEWLTTRIKKDSMFLTSAGAPYDFRWKALSPEPFEAVHVIISLRLFNEALQEVYGDDAEHAYLQDISGLEDPGLVHLLEHLKGEVTRPTASQLFVRGIAAAIAIHLARNYTELTKPGHGSPSLLPGFKLRQITDWMGAHATENFHLDQLAALANLSKFHFHRLFKSATGVSPSQYQINLRVNMAQRLLRETKKSVMDVALEVGYANPGHFAKLFRRTTGLSPTDYRRQR